jgi:hypothetical protein
MYSSPLNLSYGLHKFLSFYLCWNWLIWLCYLYYVCTFSTTMFVNHDAYLFCRSCYDQIYNCLERNWNIQRSIALPGSASIYTLLWKCLLVTFFWYCNLAMTHLLGSAILHFNTVDIWFSSFLWLYWFAFSTESGSVPILLGFTSLQYHFHLRWYSCWCIVVTGWAYAKWQAGPVCGQWFTRNEGTQFPINIEYVEFTLGVTYGVNLTMFLQDARKRFDKASLLYDQVILVWCYFAFPYKETQKLV